MEHIVIFICDFLLRTTRRNIAQGAKTLLSAWTWVSGAVGFSLSFTSVIQTRTREVGLPMCGYQQARRHLKYAGWQVEAELNGLEQWAGAERSPHRALTAWLYISAFHPLCHSSLGTVWLMPSSRLSHLTPCLWSASSSQSRNQKQDNTECHCPDLRHRTTGPSQRQTNQSNSPPHKSRYGKEERSLSTLAGIKIMSLEKPREYIKNMIKTHEIIQKDRKVKPTES